MGRLQVRVQRGRGVLGSKPCCRRAVFTLLSALFLLLPSRTLRAQTAGAEEQESPLADVSAPPVDEAGLAELEDLLGTRVETTIASKTAEAIEEAPSIVTVVSAVEIRRWGYRSVGEVLQHVVGFYLLDDHIIPNLSVRGVPGGLGGESGLVKVMIDGQSVAYRYTGGNWLGVELVPLAMVDRIEIVRGPASSLYGADAFLGAVNIVTRSPTESFEGVVSGSYGVTGSQPGGRFDLAASTHQGGSALALGVAGERIDRSGLRMPASSPATVVPQYHQDDDIAHGLERSSTVWMAKGGHEYDEHTRVTAYAYGSAMTRGGDFGRWAQLVDGRAQDGRHYQTRVALSHQRFGLQAHVGDPAEFELTIGTHLFMGGPRASDRIEVGSDLYSVRRRGSYIGELGVVETRWVLHQRLRGVAGAELLIDRERLEPPLRVNKYTGAALREQGRQRSRTVLLVNPGTFLQLHWDPLEPWLKLVGGTRYDHHTAYGSQYSQRLAAISQPTPAFHMKALYGNAFMAPSPQLLYAEPLRPGDIIGNEQLRPQYVHTFEFLAGHRPHRYFTLSSSLSYSLIRDKAEFEPQGVNLAARNISRVTTLSWETQAELHYRDVAQSYVGFELVHARREPGTAGYRAQLLGSHSGAYPPWILRGGVSLQTPDLAYPLEFATQGILIPPRWASTDNMYQYGEPYRLRGVLLWNASLTVSTLEFWDGHRSSVGLNGYNLLGANGPDPGFGGVDYPLAPREFMLALRQEI